MITRMTPLPCCAPPVPLMNSRCAWVHRSFDHLVCQCEHVRRNVDLERLGGRAIDHQFEPGRAHHWQVSWLLTFEHPASVDADQTVALGEDWTVAHQGAA